MLLEERLERIIKAGTLTLIGLDGRRRTFGSGSPAVTVRLCRRGLEVPFLLDAELAFPEAYMDGGLVLEEGDLRTLLQLVLGNVRRRGSNSRVGLLSRLRELALGLMRRNPIGRSRANVAHHYDLSGDLYALFLDAERAYSCAFFETGDESLDAAQRAKERRIAQKLLLRPGHHVLDIGSGWGALTRQLCELSDPSVRASGVTLSQEQLAWATARAAESGLADRIDYRLLDYRQVEGKFDRIVSVGMFEHVGQPHYDEFFAKIAQLLTEDGVALVHSIGRAQGPYVMTPFIRKYIFPGGYIPALSEVLPSIERAGLWVTDVEILRLHYARTLRAWHERLVANREQVEALYDARFFRMWEFYLICSESFFTLDDGMVFQIQLTKDRTAVPLTRDYLARAQPTANQFTDERVERLDRAS